MGKKDISKVSPAVQANSKWILKMSSGGLLFPKENFMSSVKKMEDTFKLIHEKSQDGLLHEKGIVKKVVKQLKQIFPSYSLQLFKKFAMTRTAI